MAVDPTGKDLKAFLSAENSDGPVVMLNLLRFKPNGGRELYERYADAVVSTFLPRVGAEVVYAGDTHPAMVAGAEQWDAVLMVRYPSRAAFSQMVADPEYHEISHLRTDALEAAVLQPTAEWD